YHCRGSACQRAVQLTPVAIALTLGYERVSSNRVWSSSSLTMLDLYPEVCSEPPRLLRIDAWVAPLAVLVAAGCPCPSGWWRWLGAVAWAAPTARPGFSAGGSDDLRPVDWRGPGWPSDPGSRLLAGAGRRLDERGGPL